jgi:hypothetical protein
MARKGKKGIPRRVANQGRVNSRADATPPAALGYPAAQSNRIVETSKRLGKKIYWLIGLLGGLASIWAIWLYFSDQKTKLANVQEQLTIQPEPGSSRRAWNVVLFLINDGPATANEIVCRFSITERHDAVRRRTCSRLVIRRRSQVGWTSRSGIYKRSDITP